MGYHNGTFDGDWINWDPRGVNNNTFFINNTDSYNNPVKRIADQSQYYEQFDGYYSSDFSTPSHGWAAADIFLSSPHTVAGVNNCIKCIESSAGTFQHFMWVHSNQAYLSEMVFYRAKIYINPNSNNIDAVRIYGGANAVFYNQVTVKGKWQEVSGFNIPSSTADRDDELRFFTSPSSHLADNTDYFYIKDIEFGFIKGNHLIQENAAFRPSWDGSAFVYDGLNDYFDSSTNAINKIYDNFKNDTQGEWFGVITCPSTHTTVHSLGFEKDASYCYFGMEPEDGSLRLTYWNYGSTKIKGTSLLTLDDTYIMNISGNGSRIRMGLNGKEKPIDIVNGTDSGDWISSLGDASIMQKAIFTATGTVFSPLIQSDEIYYNRELTNKERNAVFNYLNTKYEIY